MQTTERSTSFYSILRDKVRQSGKILADIFESANVAIVAALAVAKVISMGGGAVFTAEHFTEWVANTTSGLATPEGIILAVSLSGGVVGVNIVTRYFIMMRRARFASKPKSEATIELIDDDESALQEPTILVNPPRLRTNNISPSNSASNNSVSIWKRLNEHNVSALTISLYRTFILTTCYYMIGSGTSGILSASSIARATGYNGTCTDEGSPQWEVGIVHFSCYYLLLSNTHSFRRYNFLQIPNYFITLFVKGEYWSKVSNLSKLETLLGVGTNTIGIAFTGGHTWEIINSEILCHYHVPPIPDWGIKALTILSSTSYFLVMGLMTLASVHNRNSSTQHKSISESLEKVPYMKKYDLFIKASIGIDSVNSGLGVANSVALLPGEWDINLKYLAYNWYWIGLASVAGIYGALNTLALDREAYMVELIQRFEEDEYNKLLKIHEEFSSMPKLNDYTQALIDERDDSDSYAADLTTDFHVIELGPPSLNNLQTSAHILSQNGLFSANAQNHPLRTPPVRPTLVDASTGVHFVETPGSTIY